MGDATQNPKDGSPGRGFNQPQHHRFSVSPLHPKDLLHGDIDRLLSIAHYRHVYQPEACFQNSIEPMLRGIEAVFNLIEWERWVPSLTVINALFGAYKRLTPPPRSTPREPVRHGVGFEGDWSPRTSSGERSIALGKYADGYGSARRPCVSGANWRNSPIAISDRLMPWNLSAWVVITA